MGSLPFYSNMSMLAVSHASLSAGDDPGSPAKRLTLCADMETGRGVPAAMPGRLRRED